MEIVVYIAFPIDSPGSVDFPSASLGEIDEAISILSSRGAVVYNPHAAFICPTDFTLTSFLGGKIISINEGAISVSDAVLADAVPTSVGVQRELSLAVSMHKLVVARRYVHPSIYMRDPRIIWVDDLVIGAQRILNRFSVRAGYTASVGDFEPCAHCDDLWHNEHPPKDE